MAAKPAKKTVKKAPAKAKPAKRALVRLRFVRETGVEHVEAETFRLALFEVGGDGPVRWVVVPVDDEAAARLRVGAEYRLVEA